MKTQKRIAISALMSLFAFSVVMAGCHKPNNSDSNSNSNENSPSVSENPSLDSTSSTGSEESDVSSPSEGSESSSPSDGGESTSPSDTAPVVLQPEFSQATYAYDKLVGGNMEMPLELHSSNVYYVEVNGNLLENKDYFYNAETGCLELVEDYVLNLTTGEYSIVVVTDADGVEPVTTKLTVDNSIVTKFDDVTTKQFVFGKNTSVDFNVDFSSATIKSLKVGERTIDASAYKLEGNTFKVLPDAIDDYYGSVDYVLTLSNNDTYEFTIDTNIIFYSDYDITTIHNDHISTIGHNTLYQYADGESVTVVDAPADSGLSGKALKYIPNTTDVLYDCQNIYTLKSHSCSYSWYDVGYSKDKTYIISFDYVTYDTANEGANFSFRTEALNKIVNLVSGDNGKVHHFTGAFTGEEINFGTMVRAYFPTQGGTLYFDNFKVIEVDNLPQVDAQKDYTHDSNENLTVNLTDNGYLLESVNVNGNKVEYTLENNVISIPANQLDLLVGENRIDFDFGIYETYDTFNVVKPAVVSLRDKQANYTKDVTGDIKLYGSFSEDVTITSLKRNQYSGNGGFAGWEFVHTDFSRDYSSSTYASIVTGLDDSGYIVLKEALLNTIEKEQSFTINFSNGASEVVTISSNALMYSNYDDSTIIGEFNGAINYGSPLASGFWGASSATIKEFSSGNNAYFVTQCQGAADTVAYTIRFHQHVWDWYKVDADPSKLYRFTFDYQLSNMTSEEARVKFIVMNGHPVENYFFGEGYVVNTAPADWDEVIFTLNNDGQVHTFDSGWFAFTNPLLLKVEVPTFAAAENKYAMFDEIRIVQDASPIESSYTFNIDKDASLSINTNAYKPTELYIDGNKVEATINNNSLVVAKDVLKSLALGTHNIVVKTNVGSFKSKLVLKTDAVAKLTQTTANYTYGSGNLQLDGQFAEVTLTKATRQGTHEYDTARMSPVEISTDYFLLEENGLVISQTLLDALYDTTTLKLTISNGEELEVTINSNVKFATNWDDVYVHQPMDFENPNAYMSQDRTAIAFDSNGINGTSLKYYTKQATGLAAGGLDNGQMLFGTPWATISWCNSYTRASFMDNSKSYVVQFDYRIVNAEGQNIEYYFKVANAHYVNKSITIDPNKSSFTYPIPAYSDVQLLQIASSVVGGIEGCYMLIDNYRIIEVEDEVIDYTKDYTHLVTLDETLTVSKVVKQGTYQSDSSHEVGEEIPSTYVTVSANGLVVSKDLLAQLYGTTALKVTLSNGEEYVMFLKSPKAFFVNWDLTTPDGTFSYNHQGNMYNHQDTAMISYTDNGINGKSMIYTPANAVLAHASGSGTSDNSIFTTEIMGQTSITNGFWYSIPVNSDKIRFSFDYVITTAENTPRYQFSYLSEQTGTWVDIELDVNSNHFSFEVDKSLVRGFKINGYWTGAKEAYAGSSLMIDNFSVEEI